MSCSRPEPTGCTATPRSLNSVSTSWVCGRSPLTHQFSDVRTPDFGQCRILSGPSHLLSFQQIRRPACPVETLRNIDWRADCSIGLPTVQFSNREGDSNEK